MSNGNWNTVQPENSDFVSYPKWDFDQYPICEGSLVQVRHNLGSNQSSLIEVLSTTNWCIYTVWCNAMLKDRVVNVPPGSIIRVEFKGETVSKRTGRQYKTFNVMYQTPDQATATQIQGVLANIRIQEAAAAAQTSGGMAPRGVPQPPSTQQYQYQNQMPQGMQLPQQQVTSAPAPAPAPPAPVQYNAPAPAPAPAPATPAPPAFHMPSVPTAPPAPPAPQVPQVNVQVPNNLSLPQEEEEEIPF